MTLLHHWNRLSKLPGGKWLFSKIIGKRIPYSGSISPHVEILEPGHSRISMRDTQKVRNHLDCIHAVALINLAELTSGTAMVASLPADMRGILTGLQIQYFKKSRGTITADCHCSVPSSKERREYEVEVELKDGGGEVVCRAKANWLIGPAKA